MLSSLGRGIPSKRIPHWMNLTQMIFYTISPTTLWDSKKTRSNSHLFQPGNTQPYNPNKTERMLHTTQMAVNLMASKLGNLEMHESNYDVLNKVIQKLLVNPQIKHDTSDPETMTELTDKLKEKESEMKFKGTRNFETESSNK